VFRNVVSIPLVILIQDSYLVVASKSECLFTRKLEAARDAARLAETTKKILEKHEQEEMFGATGTFATASGGILTQYPGPRASKPVEDDLALPGSRSASGEPPELKSPAAAAASHLGRNLTLMMLFVIPLIVISSLYFWNSRRDTAKLAFPPEVTYKFPPDVNRSEEAEAAAKKAREIAAEKTAELDAARKAELAAERKAELKAFAGSNAPMVLTATLPPGFVVNDSALNCSYAPPPNMYDVTSLETKDALHQAGMNTETWNSHVLLSLKSSFDDTETGWYSIRIESYPRKKISENDDLAACRTFAQLVGAGANRSEQNLGDFHFVVSDSETHLTQDLRLKFGSDVKYVRSYTTVRAGQLIAFTFSATSLEVLNKITDSMKTLSTVDKN
jgi:hypothetical protein